MDFCLVMKYGTSQCSVMTDGTLHGSVMIDGTLHGSVMIDGTLHGSTIVKVASPLSHSKWDFLSWREVDLSWFNTF